MKRYPQQAAWQEIAYLAHELGWSLDDLLDLEHRQRVRMVGLVADLEQRKLESMTHG